VRNKLIPDLAVSVGGRNCAFTFDNEEVISLEYAIGEEKCINDSKPLLEEDLDSVRVSA
jgi:hypothetical protein